MRFNFDEIYYPADVTERIRENTDEKMIDHIRRANFDHMDEIAMTYMGIKITYRELFAHIEEYARALKKVGMNKGDFITICLPNSPETVYYFYACNEIGVTPYLIDPRCVFGKMKTSVLDSNSKLFICEMGTYFAKVAENENDLPVDRIVVVSPVHTLDESQKLPLKLKIARIIFQKKKKEGVRQFSDSSKRVFQKEFIEAGRDFTGEYKTEYDPDIPAIVVNTSGTSGDSVKGAIHTNRSYNIFMNQLTILFIRGGKPQIERDNRFYGYIPFFSMYGSSTCLHASLTYGAELNLIPKFDGKKSIIELLKQRTNFMIAVPSIIEKIVEYCDKKKLDTSFVKMYVVGGDNVSPEQLSKENEILLRQGAEHKIVYGYGTTEAMMVSTTSDDERSHCPGSCGIPYPNVSLMIINPETEKPLQFNEEGEIYVHTETMFEGYLNKPEENEKVFRVFDGIKYFKTGDKGYVSESGHLFMTGRYKRLMKRPDGHQVSPIPIENSICTSELVEGCAVVGIKKDPDAPGVIPTAFIKLKSGELSISAEDVKSIVTLSLSHLSGEREMALAYRIVDSIPFTENGKMDYRRLEQNDFNSGEYYAVDDPITREYFKGMPNILMIKLGR